MADLFNNDQSNNPYGFVKQTWGIPQGELVLEADLEDEGDFLDADAYDVAEDLAKVLNLPLVEFIPPKFESTGETDGPQVVYVTEDDPADASDDEIETPKLDRLPLLIDYIIASDDLSRATKLKFAQMLTSVLPKFQNSPADRQILVDCMNKLMAAVKPE
jgi:hypothetical protein